MARVLILGAGMVGSVMAADLVRDAGLEVTIADVREESLAGAREKSGGRAKTVKADCSSASEIGRLAREADVVLGALPSRFGFMALRAVIEAKRPYCDISFMPEDAMDLDALAKQHGVTAVVDIGVAPGMSNLLAAELANRFEPCEAVEIYVGGLPRVRTWPYDYKAAFSPADVIEEYTRPSRIVEHGKTVVREALSEPELMDLPGVGTVEAFNTDGLRSIVRTMRVPMMKEKTLRYPGHIALMRAMRETGLFSQTPIMVRVAEGPHAGTMVPVRPLDVTSALLFPKWTYAKGEEDLTVMRVMASGVSKTTKKRERATWDVLDFYDAASGFTSMSRTTAFPCTIMARMLLAGKVKEKGVLPPELLAGNAELVKSMLEELGKRGVRYRFTSEEMKH